jgi:hypothetical protein
MGTMPLFGMDHPATQTAQGGVSLQGKLKPVAEILERNIERYHEYEESHPVAAEFALKGSMVVAKGVLFAGAGTISGATMGPAGAIGGAGVGFVAGISKGVADEIRGAITTTVMGDSLEPIIARGIDILAPQFSSFDSTLDERESRILACCAIGSMLTAAEFKSISKGMLRVANKGLPRPRALVKGAEPIYTLARIQAQNKSLQKPVEKKITAPETSTRGSSADGRHADATIASGRQPARELLITSQDELGTFFAQTVQQRAQEDLVTSRRLMQQEKSQDQAIAAQEIQARIEDAKVAALTYKLTRNSMADAFEGFSTVLSITGNHKEAGQVLALGHAGIKLMDSCHILATGTTLAGLPLGTTTLGPIAPFLGIASAVATLMSVFGDDDEDGNEQMTQAIQQMYHALSEQISQVHEHMMIRFDGLEHKVDDMHLHMVQGFLHLNQQMRDFHASQVYSFEKVNSDLQTLHTINAKVDALLLRPFILSCTDIERFASRSGSLANMEEREAKAHCKSLENGLLGIDPTHDLLNGHVCADFTPMTMNRILKSISLQALLGYLAQYSAAVLCQPLPHTVRPKELPNTGLFAIGAEKYLALRQATTHIPYDEQCQALQDISHVGEHALGYIDSVQNNRALFAKLLANYRVSYDRVQAICAQAFEKQGQELLDRVHTHALQVNREKFGTFPSYPDVPIIGGFYAGTNSFLSSKHAAYKAQVQASSEWIVQNKARFRIPLLTHKGQLLANPDNTILNAVVLTNGVASPSGYYQNVPLDFRSKAQFLEKLVPMEAILAERLGLGMVTMLYSREIAVGAAAIPLVIEFVKKSGGSPIRLGVAVLSGPIGYGSAQSLVNCSSSYPMHADAFRRHSTGEGDWSSGATVVSIQPIQYATVSLNLREVWISSTVSSWTPTAGSRELLSTLVDTELVNLRKAAIAQLLAQTEIGTAYARALEELDACYNALVAFGSVAGFSEQERAAVERLVNKNSFMTYHQRYCSAPMSEADNALLVLAPGTIEATSATILARFAPQAVPATAAAVAQRENAFATPLRVLLARIGHFANIYPEVARQTREEVARRAAETAERARQAQAAAQPAQPADLVQRNQHLEGMVTNLSEQVARLTAMMQQLLVQRVAQ